jgi:hypothetical protein
LTAALKLIDGPGAPFGAAKDLLEYVEEEYLLAGEADALDPDGGLLAKAVPFATRALVRRPVEAPSGSVIIEPFHNIHELAYMWRVLRPWIEEARHSWVGFTVHNGTYGNPFAGSPGGIPLLRQTNRDRYEGLQLRQYERPPPRRMQPGPAGFDPLEMRWQLAMAHPQGSGIARSLVRSMREGGAPDLVADRVMAVGNSQTANFWRLHIDNGQHAAGVDAYVIMAGPPPVGRPLGAALVSILSEGEVVGTLYPRMMCAPPDSEAPMVRGYELPGAAHLLHARDVTRAPEHRSVHNLRPFDALPRAILANLEAWLSTGQPMPPGAPIERDPMSLDGVSRDEHGNAKGGLRGPWLDVPSAQYLARCVCGPTVGEIIEFSTETMTALYGSRERFEAAFREDVDRKEATRVLLPRDAERLRLSPE